MSSSNSHRRPARPARPQVTYWNCCGCGMGAMLHASPPACANCGKQRCGYCQVYTTSAVGRLRPRNIDASSSSRSPEISSSRENSNHSAAARSRNPKPKDTTNRPSVPDNKNGDNDIRSKKRIPEDQTSTQALDVGNFRWEAMHPLTDNDLKLIKLLEAAKKSLSIEDGSEAEKEMLESTKRSLGIQGYGEFEKAYYSMKTSATTLVDPGAVDAFAHSLLNFESLGDLWTQLVKSCNTQERSLHVIERLLRRYSEDLSLMARDTQAKKMSDTRLALAAVRFVSRSRRSIAMKIWNIQAQGLEQPNTNTTEEVKEEEHEDDDGLKDDDLTFETIEVILFDKGPILSLRANIKLFISLWDPLDSNTLYRLSRSVKISIQNAVSSLREPPVPPCQIRMRFTCRCGLRLYDDFEESQSDALVDLESLLDSYFSAQPITLKPEDFESSSTPGSDKSRISRALGGLMSLWQWVLNRRQKDPRLPWTRNASRDVELGTCPPATANGQANHTLVLLCLPFMRWGKKLHQLDTCNLHSDQAFFLSLREQYSRACRPRQWSSFAKPRRVNALEFVKFEVYRSELVDIHDSPSVPDRDDKDQAKMNYIYNPLPAELNPPIGTNLLMHLFQNPEHADVEPVMYRKIPKKLRDKLQACPVKGSAVGWGVHFVEGVDWLILFSYGFIGFFFALVLAVAWSIAHNDIQSGFAMGSFMVAFVIFCLGIAQTEVKLGI